MTTKYNGWANRETWVFNLHFGDQILEQLLDLAEDGYFDDADDTDDILSYLEAYSENYLEEVMDQLAGPLASFFSDLMDETLIDHDEMARHWFDEVCSKLEELGYTVDTEEGTFELPADEEG